MEKKDLNLVYIYIMSIFAIGVTMANIVAFFGGVGFAMVGAVVLAILAVRKILNSVDKKRFGDIAILLVIEFVMLIILFFAYDFNINGITNSFPMIMRNICAIYSMIALGYVVFRYFSEIKGKRYKVVEYILGNYTPEKKDKKVRPSKEMIKKNRELENGTLEPKPISMQTRINSVNPSSVQQPNITNGQPQSNVPSAVNANSIKPVNTQSVQPQNQASQQNTETSNNEQKQNVMETIKNHPSYWE